ncbi:MAG: hypothetical protein V4622_08525 [Bacteroidota bacterium]
MKNLLYILALSFLTLSCEKQTYKLNDEITIEFDKSVFVLIDDKKTEIKFEKLVEESRCPPDVTCVWAGQVIVKIKVDNTTVFELGLLTETPPNTVDYLSHKITLLEVNYDKKDNFGKEKHSSIKLIVE